MPRRRGTPPARGAGSPRRGELLLHSLLGIGLVATGRAAAEGAATATTARRAGRPNVVLVLADDLGAETVGAYGGEDYRTPALDRLAAQGMLFADAHAYPRCVPRTCGPHTVCAEAGVGAGGHRSARRSDTFSSPPSRSCTPSRNTLMTGRHYGSIYSGFGNLKKGLATFGNVLQDAGYATFVGGKWQLNSLPGGMTPERAGFDDYLVYKRKKRDWRPETDKETRFYNPTLSSSADGGAPTTYSGAFGPDVVNDRVLAFLDAQKGADEPFFLYYPMLLPHKAGGDDEAAAADEAGKANFKGYIEVPNTAPEDRPTNAKEAFKGMVEYMDSLVGNVLDRLEALGLADDTLVLFLGDNGTNDGIKSAIALSSNGTYDGNASTLAAVPGASEVKGRKGGTLRAATHVPFIARWPRRIPGGSVNDQIVDISQVLPTLADVAGAALPKKVDGESLMPHLRDPALEGKEWAYISYVPKKEPLFNPRASVWAFTRDYKLYDKVQGTYLVGGGEGESKLKEGKGTGFFNTRVDPQERKTLKDSELTPEEWRIKNLLKAVLKRNGHLKGCTDRGAANFDRNADLADPDACVGAVEALSRGG